MVGSSKSIDEYGQSAALQGEPLDPCPYRRAILAGAKSYMGGAVACLLSGVHQRGLHENCVFEPDRPTGRDREEPARDLGEPPCGGAWMSAPPYRGG